LPFQKKIAFYGFLNSISQTLIKITSSGVPDFYQGTELWDLNMVDPDNRRPVDFNKRAKLLEAAQKLKPPEISESLTDFEDGKVKIYEIYKALEARNKNKALFQEGDYVPLTVKGALKRHIVAFCRRKNAEWAVVVAPRCLADVVGNGQLPLGEVWTDTFLSMPPDAPKEWKETFTGESFSLNKTSDSEGFFVAELLGAFPVALLLSGESKT
jgi:(1->4)-alpha-D-glucan 1-alpha-D-glucosylmutase